MHGVTYAPAWRLTYQGSIAILISPELPESMDNVIIAFCDEQIWAKKLHTFTHPLLGCIAFIAVQNASGRRQIQIRPHVAGTIYTV